jgi:hypothetical protein
MSEEDLVFVGVVHPPQDTTPASKNVGPNDFCDSNLGEMNLDGLPLHIQHQNLDGKDVDFGTHQEKSIGQILSTVTGAQGNAKIVVGRVNANHQEVIEGIENGKWPELSLQHNFTMSIDEKGERQTRTPFEVSVVEKGNRPGCRIIHCHRVPKSTWGTTSTSQISDNKNKNKNMETPVPHTDASAETPVETPATVTLASLTTKEGVAALGWTPEQLVEGVAETTANFVNVQEQYAKLQADFAELEKTKTALEKEKEAMTNVTQRQLEQKVKQMIDLLKLDGDMTPEDEQAWNTMGTPKNVEQAEQLGRVLTMNLANKIQNNARIRELERDVALLRGQTSVTSSGTFQDFKSAMRNLTPGAAATTNEPLARPTKRFASEALVDAVRTPMAEAPVVPEEAPMDPREHLKNAFLQSHLSMPQMAPQRG